jgi:hypothetical protein
LGSYASVEDVSEQEEDSDVEYFDENEYEEDDFFKDAAKNTENHLKLLN